MSDLVTGIRKIPPVTRTLVGLVLGVTLPVVMGVVSPYYILYSPRRIFRRFEFWRAVAPFFFAGSGMQLLFDLFFLYRNSVALETQMFAGRPADYLWTVMCLMAATLVTNYPLNSVIFWQAFLSGLTYLWSQIDPDGMVSLFGLPPFKALYFPFAMLLLNLVQGGPGLALQSLSGLVAGYGVHYFSVEYPRANGGRRPFFLQTPAFLQRLMGGTAPGLAGGGVRLGGGTAFAPSTRAFGGQAPTAAAGRSAAAGSSTDGARHRWGAGNRLGDS